MYTEKHERKNRIDLIAYYIAGKKAMRDKKIIPIYRKIKFDPIFAILR